METITTASWDEEVGRVKLGLLSKGLFKKKPVPLDQWTLLAPSQAALVYATLVEEISGSAEDAESGSSAYENTDYLFPSQQQIAELTEADARCIGLPPSTNLILETQSVSDISSDDFRLESRWLKPSGAPANVRVKGPLLEFDGNTYRLPGPLYHAYNAARMFDEIGHSKSDRFRLMSDFKAALPEELADQISSDGYVDKLSVQYAGAFSVSIKPDTEDFQIEPILFSKRQIEEAGEHGDVLDEVEDNLLIPREQEVFADRFSRANTAKSAYLLGSGSFVFLDPSIQKPLKVLKKLQTASKEHRKAFLSNPRRVLGDALGEGHEAIINKCFVETQQFSERVSGIAEWQKPILPWIKPKPNSWLPESFGIDIAGVKIELSASEATQLASELSTAEAAGLSSVEFNGHEIPVTPKSISIVGNIVKLGGLEKGALEDNKNTIQDVLGPIFLTVDDNLEATSYRPVFKTSKTLKEINLPATLKATLKPYQLEGVSWLAQSLHCQVPGVLLADDMGLGKTLQALTAIAWHRANTPQEQQGNLPNLIVSPTALIHNWRVEAEKHFERDTFGEILVIDRETLRTLKRGKTGSDTKLGKSTLDLSYLSQAGLIVASYETIRDYHLSFARIPVAFLVFDEAQKMKNPASQITRAAKTLNAKFRLAITGTPVENRLQDLWSVTDVVWPGLLGASKDFSENYREDEPETSEKLRELLTKPSDQLPLPFLLRRMKSDQLEGLPSKLVQTYEVDMPTPQAKSYIDIVNQGAWVRQNSSKRGSMLQIIHALRGVSLHPDGPEKDFTDSVAFCDRSARLSKTLEILETVRNLGEKALVFCEDRGMQLRLNAVLRKHFDLPHDVPVINGEVLSARRQRIVDDFQNAPSGFGVMILSPKAGGVGLTITAANHIVHLSRWWNPAVEDQATDRVYRIGQEKDVHVHIPIAICPTEELRESSFDLKLNQMLERKRQLSSDLLMPGESKGDLANLFDDVITTSTASSSVTKAADIGGASADTSTAPPPDEIRNMPVEDSSERIKSEASPPGAPRDRSEEDSKPVRPTLSIPNPSGEENSKPEKTVSADTSTPIRSVPFVERLASHQERDFATILAPIADRKLKHLFIRDPYCGSGSRNRKLLGDFLRKIYVRAGKIPVVEVEFLCAEDRKIRGDFERGESRAVQRKEMNVQIWTAGYKPPECTVKLESKESRRGEDFHDRWADFTLNDGTKLRLDMTGGVDRLMDQRFETKIFWDQI